MQNHLLVYFIYMKWLVFKSELFDDSVFAFRRWNLKGTTPLLPLRLGTHVVDLSY
jgi:hypothetical protein